MPETAKKACSLNASSLIRLEPRAVMVHGSPGATEHRSHILLPVGSRRQPSFLSTIKKIP